MMKKLVFMLVVGAMLLGGSGWAVTYTYESFIDFGKIHIGDYTPTMPTSYFWEQAVDPSIDPNAVISATLILDIDRVHHSENPIHMGTVTLTTGSSTSLVIGYLTPNPDHPEIDTIVAIDPEILLTLAQTGGGWVEFGVSSALITPDNYDDFNLISSRLVITYNNPHGPVVPEPGTLALAGGGLLLLVTFARRRR